MAKGSKADDKPREGATLLIDVDSFVSTRDSVVKGLATLQDAIRTLSSAYINHTNAVLGEHASGLDVDSVLAKLGDNPLLALGDLNRAHSPAKSVTGGDANGADKKERKKRQHDPNAPKRPLTPFFLYMQTARPIIAKDLGPEVPKGAVSSEGTRRWATMEHDDKQLWTDAYKDNLKLYNARVHSYKLGNKSAKDMTDAEASVYADEHNISNDNTADAQIIGESSAAALVDDDLDAEGEPEPEPVREPTPPPPPPPKSTPKAKGTRKSRAKEPEAAPTPVPSSGAIVPPRAEKEKEKPAPAVVEKEKSPDRKRKRGSKKSAAAEEAVAPSSEKKEPAVVETPKSTAKPRKKKAKSDA